jgi:hypothetical protein
MNPINRREAKYFLFSTAHRQALGPIQTPMHIGRFFPGDKGTGPINVYRILRPGFAVAESKVDQDKGFEEA